MRLFVWGREIKSAPIRLRHLPPQAGEGSDLRTEVVVRILFGRLVIAIQHPGWPLHLSGAPTQRCAATLQVDALAIERQAPSMQAGAANAQASPAMFQLEGGSSAAAPTSVQV
jgi:hypothetical protein